MPEPCSQTDALAHAVIGAAIEVHRHLGPGFLERVYEQALAVELRRRGIPFKRQHSIHVAYKGVTVGEGRLDMLVGERLIVEIKAVQSVVPTHKAVVISYLKATRIRLALLINFRVARLRDGIQRLVLS
jgi:GxxExxY protein